MTVVSRWIWSLPTVEVIQMVINNPIFNYVFNLLKRFILTEMEMEENLNEINSDIEIKTKLIEQLELSQERIQLMRQHYEEKLTALTSKIFNTQKERDEVLANMGKCV